jgi:gliding motility-associated-like protein
MKKSVLLAALLYAIDCPGQCPPAAVLSFRGSQCLGKDTLVVSSSASISKIVWYKDGVIDTTVLWGRYIKPFAITVAGGNGHGAGATQFLGAVGVFLDSAENIYVPDNNNNRVQKFPKGSTGATPGVTVAGGNGQGDAANQLNHPYSVTVDPAGYLYVADGNNNRVQKFPPGSTSSTNGTTAAGGNFQGGDANQFYFDFSVYLDAGGYLYVADNLNQRIQKFPPGSTGATNGVTVAGNYEIGSTANQLSYPSGVCVDRAGNIYVADERNNRIQEFPPNSVSGTDGKTVAGGNTVGLPRLSEPNGVFVDAGGNIYVSDYGYNRIQKFPPGSDSSTDGITLAGGHELGSAPDQFGLPRGICLDRNGDIFVADVGNDRIQEFLNLDSIDHRFIPSAPGTYTAIVTDSAGCVSTTGAIVIDPVVSSAISISAAVTTICAGDTAQFSSMASNAGSAAGYQWRVNGDNVGTGSDTLQLSSLVNGDIVSCILNSSAACTLPVSSADSIRMTVKETPSVVFSPDTFVIKPGGSANLNPVVGGAIVSFGWTPGSGLDDPRKLDAVASPAGTTVYTLSVTGDNGCRASGKESVIVYFPLLMPSAFTPNGDGKNDFFRIPPRNSMQIDNFSVFSRWGARVFSAANSGDGWDGSFSGRPQPAGNYVWVIRYKDLLTGKSEMRSGTVMLIR